ncbi:MAG: acetyl-CoA carboxylase carboxyltransferase subunit alpha [Elusimicrobia bacterium]|nr:acetyl-CoA carboxylase carboxyltransferase subunit alpha [Elusimicrobiota bacterium]
MLLEFEKPVVELESKIRDLEARRSQGETDVASEIKALQAKYQDLKQKVYAHLSPWQRVQLARHPKRPYFGDYVPRLFDDFMELHGDRAFGDDAALMGGLAKFEGRPVVVIGHRKGRTLQEALEQNFGMPHPEGYRKALRLMELAERFHMPVFCFVDTAGAYPGIGAEERGQAEAIARNLREMANLKTPIVVTVIGEGGSGGALAIAVGDAILMLENAWYSVISPEGCAAILFHDATKAELAAKSLKLTAEDLKSLGVIDDIVAEPVGGAQRDPDLTASNLKEALRRNLEPLLQLPTDALLARRFEKFRSMGAWQESKPAPSRRPKKKQS